MESLTPAIGAQVDKGGGPSEKGLGDRQESGGALGHRFQHRLPMNARESIFDVQLHPRVARASLRHDLHRMH